MPNKNLLDTVSFCKVKRTGCSATAELIEECGTQMFYAFLGHLRQMNENEEEAFCRKVNDYG